MKENPRMRAFFYKSLLQSHGSHFNLQFDITEYQSALDNFSHTIDQSASQLEDISMDTTNRAFIIPPILISIGKFIGLTSATAAITNIVNKILGESKKYCLDIFHNKSSDIVIILAFKVELEFTVISLNIIY